MSDQVSYELDIRFPDQSPHRVEIEGKLSLGSSEKSDLCIEDYGLSPVHLSFRTHNGVLSLHNLAGKNKTLLADQELIHGKMYILNIGDELKIGDINIFIREGEQTEETPEELKSLFEDETDPNVEAPTPEKHSIEYEEVNNEDSTESAQEEENSLNFQSINELADDEDDDDEDYEEEAGEKTLVEKLTGIFKFKKTDLKEQIVSNNKNKTIPMVAPGFFTRLFSFLSLLAISYTVVDQIFPIFEVGTFIDKYLLEFKALVSDVPYSKYVTLKILHIVVAYFAIDLITTFLFGVNIAYLLLGVRNDSGAIAKRLKGVLRSIIGLATTPFIIFDLPCIVKKRSLKEFITSSRLHTPSKFLQTIGFLFVFPIFVLSPLYAPLLPHYESFSARNILQQKRVKFSKKEKLIEKEWSNSNISLNFKGSVPSNQLLFPSIKLKKTKADARLKFNSLKKLDSWSSLSMLEEVDLLNYIKEGSDFNPMFSIHYPDLIKSLSKESKSSNLSKLDLIQLEQLLKKSMNLDPLKLHETFLSHGPFLQDLLLINKNLKKSLDISSSEPISIYRDENKLIVSKVNRNSNVFRSRYLIIFNNRTTYLLRSSIPKKYFSVTSKLILNFLQSSTPYSPINYPEEFSWDQALNTLSSIVETKKDLTEDELAKTYEFFFEFSRMYMVELLNLDENKRTKPLNSLVKELKMISSFLEGVLEFNEFNKVEELSSSINRLIENIESNNLSFFSINQ